MTLPALMPPYDQTRVRFQRTDGTDRPDLRHSEPGTWWNGRRGDVESLIFADVTQVVDLALGGTDPIVVDESFFLTITPKLTQTGSAGSDGLGEVTIEIPVTNPTTLAAAVLAIIDAAETAGELLAPDDLATWQQFIRYASLTVSPTGATVLRISALNSGFTFDVTLTPVTGVTVTPTTISEPSTTTMKVGFYAAIDRTRGANGFNNQGGKYIKVVEASTPEEDIVGPIFLGNDTLPVEKNYPYREYAQGFDMSGVLYGQLLVYAETAIPASSIQQRVYVRHTASGDLLPGMAANQASAEAGATAAVVTVTPVAADSTLYEFDVVVGGTTIGTVSYTSSAAPATADEIAGAYRTQLAAIASAYLSKYGVVPYTLDAAFGSPVVITGRADGTSVVLTPTAANVGDNGIVATTPAVSTHRLLALRGDRFLAQSLRIGSAPIDVPHTNAA